MPSRIEQHWLSSAKRLPSPNQDERPVNTPVRLIVIHNISLPPGEFGGSAIDQLFLNQLDPAAHPAFASLAGLKVSSHLLIRRDGSLHQYVSFDKRAWHAGRSCYHETENCNDFSIGIELEGTDYLPYESLQYDCLVEIVSTLIDTYPTLSSQAITGHEHIAPGRKTDPGPAFDWERFHQQLQQLLAKPMAVQDRAEQIVTGALI